MMSNGIGPFRGLRALPRQLAFTCVTPGCDTTLLVKVQSTVNRRVAVKRVILSKPSTEYTLTWSQKVTPSGRVYSQQQASARRTSDSGSIGSQATWPTPRTSDEKNGRGKTGNRSPEAAAKAGWTLPEITRATWPTPTTPNGGRSPKDGAMTTTGKTPDGKKRQVDINWIAQQTAHFGPTQSGSPEQTEKRGALNPEFPCWLMGFPPEWDACAPTEMPSSRKSRRKS
jgi:hypothetical protein